MLHFFQVRKVFRITLYVLLCTLLLSLGDGPFIDEIIGEAHQEQARMIDHTGQQKHADTGSYAGVYQTLLNFLGTDAITPFVPRPPDNRLLSFERKPLVSRTVSSPERPPRRLA